MTDDDFSVTTKTSLHRREAAPLVMEGYRIIVHALAAQGCRLLARMRRRMSEAGCPEAQTQGLNAPSGVERIGAHASRTPAESDRPCSGT
ncbi:MAG: hypothetical protein KGI67_07710 [Pseudomonadota bacterium]|nr:hypothetical protein [Pseudomonadota bacterium]MDE3106438.1 hypothetical protein [Acidobacteriota bacterium]